MPRKKFLRGKWRTYSKFGRTRKKKRVYRKPRGRHNKMREKRKGNPKKVEIGYKKTKKQQKLIRISGVGDLLRLGRDKKAVLSRVGEKKKSEIVKKAKELGIELENVNVKKFMKKIEIKKKQREKKKLEKQEKKKKAEKKTKEKEKAEKGAGEKEEETKAKKSESEK